MLIIIALLLLVAGGVIMWQKYKHRIIKTSVSETIAKKTNRLYSIATGQLKVDEVAGNLTITNLALQPDSNIYNRMVGTEAEPSVLVQINIPALTVEGVKTPKALLNSTIDGRKVMIHSPRIELFFTGKGKDSLKSVPNKEVYREILGSLEQIKIDTLSVINATLVTRDWKTGEVRMQLDSVFIDLFRISVDSLHDKDTSRILFAEEAGMRCKKARWTSKNKLYQYEIRDIDLNSTKKKLSVNRFTIDPTLGEAAFLRQFKHAHDRFDIDLRDIMLTGMNVSQLMKEQVVADKLTSGRSSIRIYRDLSYPHDGKNRVGTYPHQLLMKLPFVVDIRNALFSNGFIEYKERNGKSEKSGQVQFFNTTLRISNLTGSSRQLAAQPMRLQFNAQFLNQAPLQALIHFYPEKGKFTMEGSLGGMPAATVNRLTEPMGLAKVESGTIKSLRFNFTGNDHAADGQLTLLYDDLKISLLKKDTTDKTLNKKKLASMLANLQVKNANPGKNHEVRHVQVHYDRNVQKSWFNLIWKSVFTGVKQTVGIE